MKLDNDEFSADGFQLRLNQLRQEEAQLKEKEEEEGWVNWACSFQQLPMSINPIASGAYFAIFCLFFICTIDGYQVQWERATGHQGISFLMWSKFFLDIQLVGDIVNSLLLLVIVLCFVFHQKQTQDGIRFFLEYIGSNLYPYLRYLIQLYLHLSAYFALGMKPLSMVLFVFACLVALAMTALLQNFTKRKDEFCCKSIEYALIFRCGIIIGLALNIGAYDLTESLTGLLGFGLLHLLTSGVLVFFYYVSGLVMYRHMVPRASIFLIVVGYLTLSLSMITDAVHESAQPDQTTALILLIPLIGSVVGFFCLSTLMRIRRLANNPDADNLKNKIFFFFNKFEGADTDEEDDCEIRGWMFYHKMKGCNNPYCVVNRQESYDSKKKKYCSISRIAQGKVSLIKFYVKCLYEQAMVEHPDDIGLKLEYVQFFFMKLKNIFLVMHYIRQIQRHYLAPFQRLRLARLKQLMKEESNKFSEELYLKKLSMERVMQSQQSFERIRRSCQLVLRRNWLFWRYLSRNEVILSDMLQVIRPNFDLVDWITQQWSLIVDYFDINRQWKFYFLCYTIYIKNEKATPALVEHFGNSVEYDAIFKSGNYFIDKTSSKEALYNPVMLYEQNTCFVHASCDQDKMLITKVSNYVARNFEFEPSEILGRPVERLMTPTVQQFHHGMMLHWLREGRNNNEESYVVKKVHPLTKRGFINPCFIFYKLYIRIGMDVEYIAMLKRSRQEELILITNCDFEIEGITLALAYKLKLSGEDCRNIKGLNLVCLMPAIARYTHFARDITPQDHYFEEQEEHKNSIKKQGTFISSGESVGGIQNQDGPMSSEKQLSLAGVKLFWPSDSEASSALYEKHKKESVHKFSAIKMLVRHLMKSKAFSKYKAEVCLREKEVMKKRYYEVELNELEENNRLERLKGADDMVDEEEQEGQCNKSGGDLGVEEEGGLPNQMTQADVDLFLQLSKKKDMVVVVPSNNIFLKEENNKALHEISHISNITLLVRVMLLLFLAFVGAQLGVETEAKWELTELNIQYYEITKLQKLHFMLSNQFNIKRLQVATNPNESSMYVIEYTHELMEIIQDHAYQKVFFQSVNKPNLYGPYFDPYPAAPVANYSWKVFDQYAIIPQVQQMLITLHRIVELTPNTSLAEPAYYNLDNYIMAGYDKNQGMKTELQKKATTQSDYVKTTTIITAVCKITLTLVCLVFTLTRLCKVTGGFEELVSIFIQMDNTDIKKIVRFIEYSSTLFDHLARKHGRMGAAGELNDSSSYISRDFERPSSELMGEEAQMLANANLNKKIKKMEMGNTISQHKMKAAILITVAFGAISIALVGDNIYSYVTLTDYSRYQDKGYILTNNFAIMNVIMDGVMHKLQNASAYTLPRYQPFLDILTNQQPTEKIDIAKGDLEFDQFFKKYYFDNVCSDQMMTIAVEMLQKAYNIVCRSSHINPSVCQSLKPVITIESQRERCQTYQDSQLVKGALNYMNYFRDKVEPYMLGGGNYTTTDALEMMKLEQILNTLEFHLLNIWKEESLSQLQQRFTLFVVLTLVAVVVIIGVEIVFIELLLTHHLKEQYSFYRRMHENLIPDFVINKEKMIKAKLIKEGFMKA